MECNDAKLKAHALVDGELPESEIDEVMDHAQSCYQCRQEYVELLKLQRKMRGLVTGEPSQEWFEKLNKKIGRRMSSSIGQILFIASYIALIGYAVYTMFSDGSVSSFIKIAVGGILLGVLVLLGVTISDRVRESKDDKYKGVIK
jgi:hypothetical protein